MREGGDASEAARVTATMTEWVRDLRSSTIHAALVEAAAGSRWVSDEEKFANDLERQFRRDDRVNGSALDPQW